MIDACVSKPVSPSEVLNTLIGLFSSTAHPVAERRAHPGTDYTHLRGRRVLLVEDNEINQEVAQDLLGIAGMLVSTADDGLQAIRMLEEQDKNNAFDIILMDMQMPVLNGLDATRRIRAQERFNALPILALTANALSGDRERCLEAGMNDYVAKPIDPEQMYATIARWLPATPPAIAPQKSAEAAAIHTDTATIEALKSIPDLDVDLGLARMLGRVDLYLKLVGRVVNERTDLPQQIQAALDSGNRDEAGRLVHGLRAIVGMLGATALQGACAEVEQQITQDESASPDAAANLQNFLTRLGALFVALRAALGTHDLAHAEPSIDSSSTTETTGIRE
jgi:CheY-like chemotaxis protein/HPt (histidine-containing phosphotransfer) domain-containing protein